MSNPDTGGDAFANRPARAQRGPRCSVGIAVQSIDPNGPLRRLAAVLEDDTWTAVQIAQVLHDNGIDVRPIAVARHRRRHLGNGCACP